MSTSPKPESVVFSVRVIPRSSQNKVELVSPSSLKVWVTAPPVDGEANASVCALLAVVLSVAKSSVVVTSGLRGRSKTVHVSGLSVEEVACRLAPGKSA